MIIETIASTLEEALTLEKLGADRIELVSAVTEGGLTPSLGLIEAVTSQCKIPVNVMLKTRSDYQMNAMDQGVLLRDLAYIKKTKANGIVFGALCGKRLNKEMIQLIYENKGHLEMTLNRCFDKTEDMEEALAWMRTLKVERILTSGHESSVILGAKNLKHIQEVCKESIVMAGAGLTVDNVENFVREYHPLEVHFGSATHEDGKWNQPISQKRMKMLCSLKNVQ